jgi:predicted transcriptional regulator
MLGYRHESSEIEFKVLDLLIEDDGLTDDEVAERLIKKGLKKYTSYSAVKQLASKGKIKRVRTEGKPIRNYIDKAELYKRLPDV